MNKVLLYWVPVILWMGIIFVFSNRQSMKLAEDTVINFMIFKSFHIIEYAFLYILLYRAVLGTIRLISGNDAYYYAFVMTMLYAVSDEIHQLFTPTREGRLRDVIIDAFGALLAWTLLKFIYPKLPKRLRILAGISPK